VIERGVVEEGRERQRVWHAAKTLRRGGGSERARALSLFCALARAGGRAHTQGKCKPSKQQRIAVRCSVLQCVAVCCGVVQFVGVRCSVPQCGGKVQTFKAAALAGRGRSAANLRSTLDFNLRSFSSARGRAPDESCHIYQRVMSHV